MNNKFSFTRLWQYAKAEITSSRRFILLALGAVVGLFVIIYYLNHLATSPSDYGDSFVTESYTTIPAIGFVWFTIAAICAINVSRSFRNYFSKGYGTSTMMLPVSMSEKFTYSVILNIIVIPIVLIAIASLNDLIWTAAYGIDFSFLTINKELNNEFGCLPFLMVITSGLFNLTLYHFGAVFFRRYQLILTMLSTFLILTIVIVVGAWLARMGLDLPGYVGRVFIWIADKYSSNTAVEVGMIVWSSLLTIGSFVMLAFSWCRFRKLQITK